MHQRAYGDGSVDVVVTIRQTGSKCGAHQSARSRACMGTYVQHRPAAGGGNKRGLFRWRTERGEWLQTAAFGCLCGFSPYPHELPNLAHLGKGEPCRHAPNLHSPPPAADYTASLDEKSLRAFPNKLTSRQRIAAGCAGTLGSRVLHATQALDGFDRPAAKRGGWRTGEAEIKRLSRWRSCEVFLVSFLLSSGERRGGRWCGRLLKKRIPRVLARVSCGTAAR